MNSETYRKRCLQLLLNVGLLLSMFVLPPSTQAAENGQVSTEEVMVVYKNEAGKDEIIEKSIKVHHYLDSLSAMTVTMTKNQVQQLKEDPDIDHIEQSQPVNLLGEVGQWNVENINISSAWNEGYTGEGVKVAVIDSGVNTSHDDLNVVESHSFVEDDPNTVDVDESWNVDRDGHGTHVAGIIGANFGGRTYEGRDIIGVSPGVSLYSLKALDGREGTTLDIIEAINWAIDHQMDIINLSLGTQTDSPMLHRAVDEAYANGILVVGASGNDGNDSSVRYPARYDSVIATSSVNALNELSEFASVGPEIEFAAPGEPVLSTYSDSYAFMGGTSQAAPHVSGFLAILMQKHPEMTATEIRQELRKYVDDLGAEGKDPLFGYGFIDYLSYEEGPTAKELLITRLKEEMRIIEEKLNTSINSLQLWEIETVELAADMIEDPNMDQIMNQLEQYKASIGLKEFETISMTPEKTISINFNTPMDPDSVTDRNLFIRHNAEFVEDIQVNFTKDGKTLKVTAPEGGYQQGKYSLYIGTSVKAQNGKELAHPVVMDFQL